MRQHSFFDRLCGAADNALRTLSGSYATSQRPNPATKLSEADLNEQEQVKVSGLMRINHTGEICAQALYQGQALTAQLPDVRQQMEEAATEENDHLDWCDQRLTELSARPSLFNPVWYLGSFTLGAIAGAAGDKWSLGFVAETERQVVDHLDRHLAKLPANDARSKAILEAMRTDELHHAENAEQAGGAPLPLPVRHAMSGMSKVMKAIAYRM